MLTSSKSDSEELVELEKLFKRLDSSQDGTLTVQELKNGLNEVYGGLTASSSDWSDLIQRVDSNGDGKIDYGEFIMAATNRQRLLNQENLEAAFKKFDINGDGIISLEELKNAFNASQFGNKE